MKTIGIYDAKTTFSALIKEVAAGERIVITHRGEAVAELRPPNAAAADAVERLLQNEIPLGIDVREAIEEGRR